MSAINKEKLISVLKALKSDADLPEIREEVKQFLENVDPLVLSLAEQELLKEGMNPEELRKLCEIHLQVLSIKEEKSKPEQNHPISILKVEHDIILKNLDILEEMTRKANVSENFGQIREELNEIKKVANLLIEAEKHHQREEEALFPALEERGVTGPPRIMRMEHYDLRRQKKALEKLTAEYGTLKYIGFLKKLNELVGYIAPTLRAHIDKENNILYPTALKILDEKQWLLIKEKFDEIGYCSFTPKFEIMKREEIVNLDLRNLPPSERHAKIFEVWNALTEEQTLRIINDHDPKPLYYEFEAEHKGTFEWEYEQGGPKSWVVRIKKIKS